MYDKYENEREKQRKQIELQETKREEKRQEFLNNVMSFSEYFDRSFFKLAKKIRYNNNSLYSLLQDNIRLDAFPTNGELKNNFDVFDVKCQILETIKNTNYNDFVSLSKYSDRIKISLSYQNVFIFDYSCRCVVVTSLARSVRCGYYDGCVSSNTSSINFQNQQILDFPKGRLNIDNIKKLNFIDVIPSDMTIKTNKTIMQLYTKLKRDTIRYIEKSVKKLFAENNYCLRIVDFNKISIKKVLIPIYTLHCKKPGFDIKYLINANTKEIL